MHIQCEDGTVASHTLILSIASPFLRRLLETEQELNWETRLGREPLVLVLPDVKVAQVQALLEFIYTGSITTAEGQLYGLMKLVYDLGIVASVEAVKTNGPATKFEITTISPCRSSEFDCQSCRPRKRARIDTFDSTFNALLEASSNVQNPSKNFNMSQESLNQWAKSGGLVVNSLTASGVEVKQEPEEKPSLSEQQAELKHKASISLGGINTLSSNSVNNNQLGHFVSVNPGYQVSGNTTTSRYVSHLIVSAQKLFRSL